jgi:hypothetical protein
MPLDVIAGHVQDFIAYAKEHQEMHFSVVKIGCGLAGFNESQISPMFHGSPKNVDLPTGWR